MDEEMSTNRTTEALLQAIRIINREIKNPDKLDQVIQELQETIEKGVTAADQSNR